MKSIKALLIAFLIPSFFYCATGKPETKDVFVNPEMISSSQIFVSEEMAKKLSETETVLFELVITPEGKTQQIKILQSTNRKLNKLAKTLMEDAKFKPATKNGEPIATKIRIPLHYNKNK